MPDQPVSVMLSRFPFNHHDEPDVTDWMVDTSLKIKSDSRISEVFYTRIDDTPITMGRNRVLNVSHQKGIDFLLMIDNDIKPDAYLASNPYAIEKDKDAEPFWDVAFNTVWNRRRLGEPPCLVAAPYCGPPPKENVYAFYRDNNETGAPSDDATNFKLTQYSRHETLYMEGVQPAGALATGLILIDLKALNFVNPPYTFYEWDDTQEQSKASSEDVTFTRDLGLAGAGLFCTWSSWAGHWKRKCVGRPNSTTAGTLSKKFRDVVLRDYNINPGEKLVDVSSREPAMANGEEGSDFTDS